MLTRQSKNANIHLKTLVGHIIYIHIVHVSARVLLWNQIEKQQLWVWEWKRDGIGMKKKVHWRHTNALSQKGRGSEIAPTPEMALRINMSGKQSRNKNEIMFYLQCIWRTHSNANYYINSAIFPSDRIYGICAGWSSDAWATRSIANFDVCFVMFAIFFVFFVHSIFNVNSFPQ